MFDETGFALLIDFIICSDNDMTSHRYALKESYLHRSMNMMDSDETPAACNCTNAPMQINWDDFF